LFRDSQLIICHVMCSPLGVAHIYSRGLKATWTSLVQLHLRLLSFMYVVLICYTLGLQTLLYNFIGNESRLSLTRQRAVTRLVRPVTTVFLLKSRPT